LRWTNIGRNLKKKLCEELCDAQILLPVQDRLTLAAEWHSEAGEEDVEVWLDLL
jgi:hypothetical protein